MKPNDIILSVEGCVSQAARVAAGFFLNLLKTIEHFVFHLPGTKLEVRLYLCMPLISAMTDSDCKLMMAQKNTRERFLGCH